MSCWSSRGLGSPSGVGGVVRWRRTSEERSSMHSARRPSSDAWGLPERHSGGRVLGWPRGWRSRRRGHPRAAGGAPGGSAGGSLGRAPSVSTSAACRHKDKSTGATSRLTSRREPVAVPDEAEQRGTIRLPAPRRDAYHPSHVRACCNNSLPGGSWTIHVWRRSDPSRSVRIPYSCTSYRCPSVECRPFAAHLASARSREAMTRPGLEARGWVFLVLPLDRLGTYSGRRPWRDEQEAFRDLQRLSQALLRGLRRE